MSRRISIDQLQPGMFVRAPEADALAGQRGGEGFIVRGEADIRRLVESGVSGVDIDPARGLDVLGAPSDGQASLAFERQIVDVAGSSPPVRHVGVAEELAEARGAAAAAADAVRCGMADVRRGRPLCPGHFLDAVERMAQSIRRNADALLFLTRIRNEDDYTVQHSVAVSALLMALARMLGADDEGLVIAGTGGLLHDIGTARIDETLLGKANRLTRVEFDQMQGHAMEGGRLLRETGHFHEDSIRVVEQHHERADGSGYPAGLCGRDCSRIGQMAAICDAYDAISTDRPYQRGVTPHLAMSRLLGWSRDLFNSELTHQFLRMAGIYPAGTLVRLASGRLALVLEQSGTSLLQPVVRAFYDLRRDSPVPAEDIDLASADGPGGGDRIVRHELAERWGFDLGRLAGLTLEWR